MHAIRSNGEVIRARIASLARYLVRVLDWFLTAWPAWVWLLIFAIHMCLLSYFPDAIVNDTIALLTQLVGATLVLISIDSALGLMKKQSLLSMPWSWVRSFPRYRQVVNISASGGRISLGGGIADLTARVEIATKTVDERIEYLEQEMQRLWDTRKRDLMHMEARVDQVERKLALEQSSTREELDSLTSQVERISVGGVKVQALGAALIVHGSVAGWWPEGLM